MFHSHKGPYFKSVQCKVTQYSEGLLTFSQCGLHSFCHTQELLIVEGEVEHISLLQLTFSPNSKKKLLVINGYWARILSASATYWTSKHPHALSRYNRIPPQGCGMPTKLVEDKSWPDLRGGDLMTW